MTNKEQYIAWVATQHSLPIFMQPWWLDAVCAGKEWDVILVDSEELTADSEQKTATSSKNIVAAMPFLLRKKWWMKWIAVPQLTQICGLWLDEEREFTPEELTTICTKVNSELETLKLHYYYQQFPVNSPCPKEMEALGFKVKERVTYRINDLSNLDRVIEGFSKNKKRQLQKALSLHAEGNMTAEEFYFFHQQCLAAKKKTISYSREFLLVLEQKLRHHKQSQILTIRNADKQIYAAALLVWDEKQMYYLIPAINPTYKESGAGALLVLEALKSAREKGVKFDFEGSMIRGVAQHYKQFGSTPHKYYSVEKYYKWGFRFALLWNWICSRKYR
jgi:hypothetical protein